MKRALVIAIDGLGTAGIGPYGNASVLTPALNEFASQSFLAEQAIIDTTDLERLYRALIKGGHAEFPDAWFDDRLSLPSVLNRKHGSSAVICSESSIRKIPSLETFDHQVIVDIPDVTKLASEPEESTLASFFSQTIEAIETLDSVRQADLIWIHCSELEKFWDAPYDFRCQFVDDQDPDPPTDHLTPSLEMDDQFDPDQLLGIQCAYNGQILLLDLVLGAFLQATSNLNDCMTVLLGTRGFPLGEHGIVGPNGAHLRSALNHVPLMVRYPDQRTASRFQGLVQFCDIFESLARWLGLSSPDEKTRLDFFAAQNDLSTQSRQVAITKSESAIAIRTGHWLGCIENDESVSLFVKPDDRWDFNNVAQLCPEVVDDVKSVIRSLPSKLETASLPNELPERLLQRLH